MKLSNLILLSLLVTLSLSCSKEDDIVVDDAITLSDLVGSWIAISSVHTNNSNPDEKFELIANGGEIRYTMLEDGRVRNWVDFESFKDEWDALATISNNIVTTVPAESSRGVQKYTLEKNGETITWTNKNNTFDFTLKGGTPVSATSVTVFKPND
jgi:hypothetical protein